MDIPVVRLSRVYHLGSMDASRVGENSRGGSQEGHSLSVSLVPNAWASIARLGDELHVLEKQAGVFVDILALLDDDVRRREIVAWAVSSGLANRRELWKAWKYDDETDGWRYMLFSSEQEALDEVSDGADASFASAADVPGPDGRPGVEPALLPVGTPRLGALTGFSVGADEDATDAIAVAFAMDAGTFDGVWWNETYDPQALSAPRGAIFPEAAYGWSRSRASLHDVDDEAELGRMPESEPFGADQAAGVRLQAL